MENRMVLGIFNYRTNAEDAIARLENAGYNPKDISIVMQDKHMVEAMAEDTGSRVVSNTLSGAVAGGFLGALAGLLVATGVVPGLGTLLIGGPLAVSLGLTGAAATTVSGATTGILAGGLVGALSSFGLPETEARRYEESVRRGGILLIVPTMSHEEDDVRQMLMDFGANQVKSIGAIEGRERTAAETYYMPPREVEYRVAGQKGGRVKRQGIRQRRQVRQRP